MKRTPGSQIWMVIGAMLLLGGRAAANDCTLVKNGYGPAGETPVRAETVVSGLEVPWGILFLGAGDFLVTERAGRVRLVRNRKLEPDPVATVTTRASGEGGLLGIVAPRGFRDEPAVLSVLHRRRERRLGQPDRAVASVAGSPARFCRSDHLRQNSRRRKTKSCESQRNDQRITAAARHVAPR